MWKKGFVFCLCLGAVTLWAQVSIISVTDEDKHTTKADFAHTFEYYITPLNASAKSVASSKCQATRISHHWFATAAHCVVNTCKNGCQIQLDLLEQPISAVATINHTVKKPAVFIHPGFDYNQFVKNDLALIKLNLSKSPYVYYKRGPGNERILLSKEQFEQFLKQTPAARSALYHIKSPTFPPLLVFDEDNYILDRKISVISIFDGKRNVKPNFNPVHYVKELEFAYTKNFGVRHGMSGSGVMSNTGEFIGVISGIFSISDAKKNTSPIKEFFMFFVFNRPALEFMESVMGSDYYKLDIKNAYPAYVHKSRKDYKDIIGPIKELGKKQVKIRKE